MIVTWWNGREVPAQNVRIAPDDAGFLYGDGLFETLRVENGSALHVSFHITRLFDGLRKLEMDIPEDKNALKQGLYAVADAAPRPTARLRITITRGASGIPTRLITAVPYRPPDASQYREGVSALLLPELRIDSQSPLAGVKSTCWQVNRLALLRAERAGAFEALLLNERGRVAEGARSNLLVVLKGKVFTPPLKDGCLPGVIRQLLVSLGQATERSLSLKDLERAEEILLTNSLIGVLPVGWLGRRLAVRETGERLRKEALTPGPSPGS
jgi:branched-chain amino acid aminotransferase